MKYSLKYENSLKYSSKYGKRHCYPLAEYFDARVSIRVVDTESTVADAAADFQHNNRKKANVDNPKGRGEIAVFRTRETVTEAIISLCVLKI